ncbi:hypothetical protein ABH931_007044 [Streptacidiphilus sp. MAP12-33]|uniref:hypothetical protein n=1 Tax=Streptacidiphilus sp. MAP12-33 TaxID=3156266 RepID=UPI003519461D
MTADQTADAPRLAPDGAVGAPGAAPARGLRPAALAVGGYLLVRAVGVAVLWLWGRAEHRTLGVLLGKLWDSSWYVGIVVHGYDNGASAFSNMAFFPFFPFTARLLTLASPLSAPAAAVATAWLAGCAAAWGLYAIGNRLDGPRTGIVLALLWGSLPHAVTESMAYTESLFTALAAWTLYGVLASRWITAGILCLLAGLTRPTATALIAAVWLAALVAVVRGRGGRRALLALLLAPLGWLGYLAWVGRRVHRLDGWFHIQSAGWGSSFDGGRYTLHEARTILTTPVPFDLYLVTLVLALAAVLLVLSALDRQPWPLLLFSALLLALAVGGAGYYNAKARFLVAAFPLLLRPATALAHARTSTAVVVVGFLTAASAYLGGYLLLVWNHSP